MSTTNKQTIPFDRMKEQLERELVTVLEKAGDAAEVPVISFEKGETRITVPLRDFHRSQLGDFIEIIKQFIENIRVVSFENGHYGFQALNKSIFDSSNILENIRFDIFALITTRLEIAKKGDLTQEEISAVTALLGHALGMAGLDPRARLVALGSSVIDNSGGLSWDYIAGYEDVKRKIRESIILPLKNPEIFDAVAQLTRSVFESNRPRALLFEGPPGVGKTTVARIIAGEVDIPLVHVPIESIMSKWYGQSSQNLSAIFDACEDLGGALIFLDEIDSLAPSRDTGMFEATRRILSVLLRKIDGLESVEKTITIGATNRRHDLDPALLSRFDQSIAFPLPDEAERASIFSRYARHLAADETAHLGKKSAGISGRTIKDLCEMAERRWARRLIIKKLEITAPPFDYYRQTLSQWNTEYKGTVQDHE